VDEAAKIGLGTVLGALGGDIPEHNALLDIFESGESERFEARLVELGLRDHLLLITSYYRFLVQQRKLTRFCPDEGDVSISEQDLARAKELFLRTDIANELREHYRANDVATFRQILERVGPRRSRSVIARWLGAAEWGSPIPKRTCQVNVAAIMFNHDPASLTRDAMNIRRNFDENVMVPEWVSPLSWFPRNDPAAYCAQETAGQTITIKVRFRASPGVASAEVRASGGGVLGPIPAFGVIFDENGFSEFVEVALPNHTIASGVRVEDIQWRWEYRCPMENAFRGMDRTAHRIYVVLREPREPWTQASGSNQNPWTDALDLACTASPNQGFADPLDAIAVGLAELLNWGGSNANPGQLEYDDVTTSPHYAGTNSDSQFALSKYIERLNGGVGNGPLVNCTDCACIMTTFANLLGCDLWEGQIFTSFVNPTIPIGRGQWWLPQTGYLPSPTSPAEPEFLLYHEVAWKGDTVLGTLVWDICYLTNGFEDPTTPQRPDPTNRVMWYPYGDPFAEQTIFDYRERLAARDDIANTVPDPSSKVRRTVI
jgi:hypothetical protein